MTHYHHHDKPSSERYNEKRITRVDVAMPEHIPFFKERLITTKPWENLLKITTLTKAIEENLSRSSHAFTGFMNDKPFCIFGVVPVTKKRGHIWLLVTEDVHKVDLRFLSGSLYFLRFFKTIYRTLEALVDAEYEASVKWLRWLGFKPAGKKFISEIEMYKFELTGY